MRVRKSVSSFQERQAGRQAGSVCVSASCPWQVETEVLSLRVLIPNAPDRTVFLLGSVQAAQPLLLELVQTWPHLTSCVGGHSSTRRNSPCGSSVLAMQHFLQWLFPWKEPSLRGVLPGFNRPFLTLSDIQTFIHWVSNFEFRDNSRSY